MKRLMSVESSTCVNTHAPSAASEVRNSQRIARSLIALGAEGSEKIRASSSALNARSVRTASNQVVVRSPPASTSSMRSSARPRPSSVTRSMKSESGAPRGVSASRQPFRVGVEVGLVAPAQRVEIAVEQHDEVGDVLARDRAGREVHRLAAGGVAEEEAVAVDHEPRLARLARLAAEPIRRHEVERAARLERLGEQREPLLLAESRLRRPARRPSPASAPRASGAARCRACPPDGLRSPSARCAKLAGRGRQREQHRREQRSPSV